jgi:sRNA-binding protein
MRAGALAALLLVLPVLGQAQMYKCVDERGVTTYTDGPRPGCKGGEVDIRGQQPISGALQENKSDIAREEADFRRRQIQRDREEAQEQAALARRKRDCDALRNEYAQLSRARRVVRIEANGERTYLDDDAREKRMGQLRDRIASCP